MKTYRNLRSLQNDKSGTLLNLFDFNSLKEEKKKSKNNDHFQHVKTVDGIVFYIKTMRSTYKLFKCDEFIHRLLGIYCILARSIRKVSSDGHPSNDGNSLKFLASDKTLVWTK